VIHGELDYRVPATQALQYYNTLKAKDVPARLVYFPDENHWILKPRNSRLWYREFFDWIARFAGRRPRRDVPRLPVRQSDVPPRCGAVRRRSAAGRLRAVRTRLALDAARGGGIGIEPRGGDRVAAVDAFAVGTRGHAAERAFDVGELSEQVRASAMSRAAISSPTAPVVVSAGTLERPTTPLSPVPLRCARISPRSTRWRSRRRDCRALLSAMSGVALWRPWDATLLRGSARAVPSVPRISGPVAAGIDAGQCPSMRPRAGS